VLPEKLGFTMENQDKYQQLIEIVTYLENEYLLTHQQGYGLVITNYGINEIEESLLEPEKATYHFAPNMKRFVTVDESLIDFILTMKKARKDFLIAVYQNSGGYVTAIVNPFEIKEKLGLDDDVYKRVYFYLIEDGFIEYIHSGGISLTHSGKMEVENIGVARADDKSIWSAVYPDLTNCDDLAIILDKFNTLAKNKLGCEIFRNNAKLYLDLRNSITYLNKDSKDKNAFITFILSIASIIGDVQTDIIRGKIDNKEIKGSINLIQELFDLNSIHYDEEDFVTLRKLIRLRSTTPPIHLAEEESKEILNYLGVNSPPIDWAEAADNYLKAVLKGLNNLANNLENIHVV